MKKFTIKEIKEQGIWVKCSKNDANRLIQVFDYEKYKDYLPEDRIDFFYQWDNKRNSFWSKGKYETPPESFIEFSQIDFEDRKQIGWLVKKECWGIKGVSWQIGTKLFMLGDTFADKTIAYFTETGLINNPDYFEPIYEEVQKFNVGDKIVITSFGRANNARAFSLNTVYELSRPFNEYWGLKVVLDNDGGKNNGWRNAFDLGITIRLATPSEIAAAEKIEIGGYKVEFKNGTTFISGNEFTKEFWQAAKLIPEHSKAKIMVGCSKQFDVDLTTINKILSKLC